MPNRALLVMDVQKGIVQRFPDPGYVPRLRRAIDAAHAAGLLVIYVTISFRDGYPEVSSRNKSFSATAQRGGFGSNDPATQVHPDVAPDAGDVVVTKRRVSAFTGSDLAVVLRRPASTRWCSPA